MRRREKLGKASGGVGSVCVVVGGFKISCSLVGSHVAQRRPSKEKNHHRLFYLRAFTAYYSTGIDPMVPVSIGEAGM